MKFMNMKHIKITINQDILLRLSKKIFCFYFFCCFSNITIAQQLPQMTQYMINNYAVNPAIAGMEDHYQVKTTIRNMWGGIEGAPQTTILSIYGKRSENMGLGGIVYSDKAGATSRIGGNVSYTHHGSHIKGVFACHNQAVNE